MKKYLGNIPVHLLPLGIEDIPPSLKAFDTVFSMGVLYHRRSPLDHLYELRDCLKPGGELVLETLVIEGDVNSVLVPTDRYQQMRNVWFLPSCDALVLWMERCGFKNVRVVDVTNTSIDEQRATDWMTFDSLENFLDPNDPTKTIEVIQVQSELLYWRMHLNRFKYKLGNTELIRLISPNKRKVNDHGRGDNKRTSSTW